MFNLLIEDAATFCATGKLFPPLLGVMLSLMCAAVIALAFIIKKRKYP